jgi:predicted RNA-binding Zn-ribbon protein involved in translation (DUF1610 family)
MKCPNCGYALNHHANKLPSDAVEPNADTGSPLIEAYSCPHCGMNASRTVQRD